MKHHDPVVLDLDFKRVVLTGRKPERMEITDRSRPNWTTIVMHADELRELSTALVAYLNRDARL